MITALPQGQCSLDTDMVHMQISILHKLVTSVAFLRVEVGNTSVRKKQQHTIWVKELMKMDMFHP